MKTKIILLLTSLFVGMATTFGQALNIDFRYPPTHYYTPICFPDDWQKTLVKDDGSLLYDFGPGPYASPYKRVSTEISVDVKGAQLRVKNQRLENPRVPIVITQLEGENIRIRQDAFSVVLDQVELPSKDAGDIKIHRKNGLNGAMVWADPQEPADPAFRNVAWGTGRPIQYRLDVEPNTKKLIALGFCEGRYNRSGVRVFELHVEGTEPITRDMAPSGKNNQPQVHLFKGKDRNGDGVIEIEVAASPKTKDPNTFVNVIWIFPSGTNVSKRSLIRGESSSKAELYVDCGQEPEVQLRDPRVDAILAQLKGANITPVITIKSEREFSFSSGVLYSYERPFFAARPSPISAQKTTHGWELELPKGTKKVEMIVINGYQLPDDITEIPDLEKARLRSVQFWRQETDLPYNRIQVPEKNAQALLDGSIRTLYQIREVVDGIPQFQPGPTVYRGLWVGDGMWQTDAITMIGDTAAANDMIKAIARHQTENGRIKVMSPSLLHRETPHFMLTLYRFARLTRDRSWLEANWHILEKAIEHVISLRRSTLSHPEALYHKLMPPGFTDGGVGGINPEYGSVYWGLIGMNKAIEAAKWLDKPDKVLTWKAEYSAFWAAFRKGIVRDSRRDENGFLYLPMRMKHDAEKHAPQRGQWALCQSVSPGNLFSKDDPLVKGTLAMLDAHRVEGLVKDVGWLKGGLWPSFGAITGHAALWIGDIQKAQQIFYAYANHAAPTLLWVEEQMPQGKGDKTTGDVPHTNANAQYIRYVRDLIVLEKGDNLNILHAVPDHWFEPGSRIALDNIPTAFGRLTLEMTVAPNGESAEITVSPVGIDGEPGGPEIYLNGFQKQGYRFSNGNKLPQSWKGHWGEEIRLYLERVKK